MTTDDNPMRFFKDKAGRIVIIQWPNILLGGWLLLKIVSALITKPQLKLASAHLGTALLFAWAILELVRGVNYFRRLLGLIVFIAIVVGFFKK